LLRDRAGEPGRAVPRRWAPSREHRGTRHSPPTCAPASPRP